LLHFGAFKTKNRSFIEKKEGNNMAVSQEFDDILTYRGLRLLRRLGNGQPSYSQIEFTQSIISLLSENEEQCRRLDALLDAAQTQSRESLRRDSLFYRK
jgi:hypothetical protein